MSPLVLKDETGQSSIGLQPTSEREWISDIPATKVKEKGELGSSSSLERVKRMKIVEGEAILHA
jgi:hypothetical protein